MRRTALVTVILILGLLTAGFIPHPDKILNKAKAAAPRISKPLKVLWNGRPGVINVGRPGRHSVLFDDGERLTDPGLPKPIADEADPSIDRATLIPPEPVFKPADPLAAFWRMLDFFSPARSDDFTELLVLAGVDVNRRGIVRMDREGDQLAYTIGAMGESEPGLPQLWIEKDTGRPVLYALGDQSFVTAGPPGPGGLPQWFRINGEWAKLTIIPPDDAGKGK